MTKRVRVLVVDDSRTVRDVIVAALGQDPRIEVVGEACDGLEAVAMTKALHPDVLTLDVQMPRLGGLDAIPLIMAEAPTPILVVCAVDSEREVDLSLRAMAAGALELMAKPRVGGPSSTWAMRLREAVRLMAEIPVIRRRRLASLPEVRVSTPRTRVDVFGIAASTGGPPALAYILRGLPQTLTMSVLVAQHMCPGFTAGLVRWLSEETPLKVEVAASGTRFEPGRVYFAPDGCDLEVAHNRVLMVAPSRSPHMPSADRLFASMARIHGARCGGIVLTGMGEDGAEGLLAIRRAGGVTFAQDEATSVVYGMPAAAKRRDAASQIVPLTAVGSAIRALSEA